MLSEIEGKEIERNQKGLEQLKEKMVKYDGAKFLEEAGPTGQSDLFQQLSFI